MKKYKVLFIKSTLIICSIAVFTFFATHEHEKADEPIYKTIINYIQK